MSKPKSDIQARTTPPNGCALDASRDRLAGSFAASGYAAAAFVLCTGCSRAPSIDILGSFFPVWMVCLTFAIFLAFGLRAVLLRVRLESEVGPLALFYPCTVIFFTGLLWLVFFR